MVTQFKIWLIAFRLRTLPLALSSILSGGAMALYASSFNLTTFIYCLTTTVSLQILSNLANDYGDASKGTDNENRIGPERSIQSGQISVAQMKKAIFVFGIISLVSGSLLLFSTSGTLNTTPIIVFFVLGLLAIWAAIKYTAGKKTYGYSGFGDIFVFLFFGLVGVSGSAFLISGEFHFEYFYPSVTIGIWSAGVLNLNNLRDYENDKNHGKNTIPVRIGWISGKNYHFSLIIIGLFAAIFLFIGRTFQLIETIVILSFVPILLHLKRFVKINSPEELDPELKKLALSTFAFSLLLLISQFLVE